MKRLFNIVVVCLSVVLVSACSEKKQSGPFTVITSKQNYNNWNTGSKNTAYSYRIRYKGHNITPSDITGRNQHESGYYISVQALDSLPGKLLAHIANTFNFPVYLVEEKKGRPHYWLLFNNGNQIPYQFIGSKYLVNEKEFSPEEGYFLNTIFDLAEDKQHSYRMPVSTIALDISPDNQSIAVCSGFSEKDTLRINTVFLSDNFVTSEILPAAMQQMFRDTLNKQLTAAQRKALFNQHFRWQLKNGRYVAKYTSY
ncbi:hypothetical protein [Chitinophaga flava]|uniref:Uncharacterized protein n=1 Tax=Chitinophaga flava TaxID=2259036 RepID=A0A365XT77_9BACT|nr:hypothetical protein [Chitinophaga flava]RBL89577.1 hypothetical protein DF182_24015 [Chitinophaga flava]